MNSVANGARGRGFIIALLVTVGLIAMVVSMVMNWRFGWGLATDQIDRVLMAVLHSLVDPGAAALIAAGGLMLAWGLRWQGWAALLFAVLLIAYSMISVYGFMSERIGQLEGHKAALAVQKGHMDWLGKQRVSWDVPRAERRTMREDMKVAMDKLAASVRIIPDRHAVAVAGMLGSLGFKVSVEAVQRGLVMAGSSVAQGIKFMCLSIGFFLWGIGAIGRQPDRKTHDGSGGGSGQSEPRKPPTLVHPEPAKPVALRTMEAGSAHPLKVSRLGPRVLPGLPTAKLSAFDRAYELAVAHPHWSTRQIADRAACSQSTGVRVKKKVRGKADAIMRRYAGNGGGRTFHSVALG